MKAITLLLSTMAGTKQREFQTVNKAYNAVFKPNRLTVGLVFPIENDFRGAVPAMRRSIERVQLAEKLGFKAVWLRDVPFNVPSFGDAGQIYDPFVYLGMLAGSTQEIALGTASIVLPLRHPAHTAKAAASVDVLSGGRFIMGVASGDRPEEYPAMDLPYAERGDRFRESVEYIQRMSEPYPSFENIYGNPDGSMDMIPKPHGSKIPLLITGSSRQDPEWIAANGEGWMTYPRPLPSQAAIIENYRANMEKKELGHDKPVMQPLYVDLVDNPDAPPRPIHLGFQCGTKYLKKHLEELQNIGVNHVALNLRFQSGDVEEAMKRVAKDILPEFHSIAEE